MGGGRGNFEQVSSKSCNGEARSHEETRPFFENFWLGNNNTRDRVEVQSWHFMVEFFLFPASSFSVYLPGVGAVDLLILGGAIEDHSWSWGWEFD